MAVACSYRRALMQIIVRLTLMIVIQLVIAQCESHTSCRILPLVGYTSTWFSCYALDLIYDIVIKNTRVVVKCALAIAYYVIVYSFSLIAYIFCDLLNTCSLIFVGNWRGLSLAKYNMYLSDDSFKIASIFTDIATSLDSKYMHSCLMTLFTPYVSSPIILFY